MRTMSRTVIVSVEAIGLGLFLIACGSAQKTETPPAQAQPAAAAPAPAPAAQPETKQYDLKGKVVGVDKVENLVNVAGEDIPGFMGAMTMGYPVKDAQLLQGLAPGDQITGKIIANGSEYWLENIAVVAKAAGK